VLGVGELRVQENSGCRRARHGCREKGRDGMETEPTRACVFGSFHGAERCHILVKYSPTTLGQEPLRSARKGNTRKVGWSRSVLAR
jgi:hypothetical protein